MKKPKPESKPERTAPKSGPASADAADREGSAAAPGAPAPGAQAPGNDIAPAQAGAASFEAAVAAALKPPEFVTLSFPLPSGIPDDALKAASIVVKAKAERGRRRAGFAFTRAETVIPFGDLSEQQLDALKGDAELSVSLRVPKPG